MARNEHGRHSRVNKKNRYSSKMRIGFFVLVIPIVVNKQLFTTIGIIYLADIKKAALIA
ncbi:hypothetical protein [Aliivibrio fischeri]|uniref:hypothetical protein n=1 Tax=Aliivibrio fischeri TaxID=668 RepID=UPI003550864E